MVFLWVVKMKHQRQTVDSRPNKIYFKTDRWFRQHGVVKGPDDPRCVGVLPAPEVAGGMCYQRIIQTGVTVRYIYRTSGLISAFNGLEMWR